MKVRPVFYVLGWLLVGLSLAMFLPAFVALSERDFDNAYVFFSSAVLTTFFAGGLIISLRGDEEGLDKRGSLMLVVLIWMVLPLFAALPIFFSDVTARSSSAALFEAISGFTTSGVTLLSDLQSQPRAILIWRAVLQWLGGFYTIVAATGIFVALGIGGMQLQFTAMPHGDGETLFKRIQQAGRALLRVYGLLTLICFIALNAAGMNTFEAFCHALSTISTGGFSTRDGSIGAFDNFLIELIIMVFMILGAINLALHWAALNGRWRSYGADPEARYFLGCLAVLITLSAVTVWVAGGSGISWQATRDTVFNSVSMLTTTGYWRGEITNLPLVTALMLLAAMLVGGGTGSTTGGFKQMRLFLLFKQALNELNNLTQPSGIFRLRYAGMTVQPEQSNAVWSVFVLFAFVLALLTVMLSISGVNFEQSVAMAISSLTNAGPAAAMFFGDPQAFSDAPVLTKFIAMAGMITGRMEVLTLVTLLNPEFWRR